MKRVIISGEDQSQYNGNFRIKKTNTTTDTYTLDDLEKLRAHLRNKTLLCIEQIESKEGVSNEN